MGLLLLWTGPFAVQQSTSGAREAAPALLQAGDSPLEATVSLRTTARTALPATRKPLLWDDDCPVATDSLG